MAAKEVVPTSLDTLPHHCTLDEIRYHIFVRQRIEEGRQEIRSGGFLTTEEVEKELAPWLGE
jgi:predicted transcriptional regulator